MEYVRGMAVIPVGELAVQNVHKQRITVFGESGPAVHFVDLTGERAAAKKLCSGASLGGSGSV